MPRSTRTLQGLRLSLSAAAILACASPAQAQNTAPVTSPPPLTLWRAHEAAWARQPEAIALQARKDAAAAQGRAASAWMPEPLAIDIATKTDQLNRNQGAREQELGVAIPLWLPGERSRTSALATAEAAAVESHARAAQLRVAARVREHWWAWQRGALELQTAQDQLASATRIAADVERRTKAGDLARADMHQAAGAVAAAESAVAQANAAAAAAAQQLKALTGIDVPADATASLDLEAEVPAPAGDAHAALDELHDRALVADGNAALAATQSRANPELALIATRDRGAYGEAYGRTVTIGLRIPLGAGPRHERKLATARADAAEARAQLALERDRIVSERDAARIRKDAARVSLAAAERRAQLARESRGFFDKSFRLGETDLPNRLRIEAEAIEAERQAARARIELSAAISAERQALGLLPQ